MRYTAEELFDGLHNRDYVALTKAKSREQVERMVRSWFGKSATKKLIRMCDEYRQGI